MTSGIGTGLRGAIGDPRGAAMVICAAAAIGLAAWRLSNPPIEDRMQEELNEGAAYITLCQFHRSYDAYRRAAALDGTDPRPVRGMRQAASGINHFTQHRRYAKGCGVTLPDAGR